ncbi:hypothetical protein PIB30_067153 [Stylosanthes scabra]|uniref:Uncharacterized protein n=1 Tax=Stylosanthes scabra TaxID=79078 RepID=A0ABU6ZLA0_9FABA|nr:hypothetical protein [Stylosanthes scabra]
MEHHIEGLDWRNSSEQTATSMAMNRLSCAEENREEVGAVAREKIVEAETRSSVLELEIHERQHHQSPYSSGYSKQNGRRILLRSDGCGVDCSVEGSSARTALPWRRHGRSWRDVTVETRVAKLNFLLNIYTTRRANFTDGHTDGQAVGKVLLPTARPPVILRDRKLRQ